MQENLLWSRCCASRVGCPILTTCSGREIAFTTRTSRGTIVPLVSLVQVVK